MKTTGTRPTRKKRPDGVTEWRDADGVIFKRAFPSGRIAWYDARGQLHRDDGPAVEGPEAFRKGLDHEVTLSRPLKLNKLDAWSFADRASNAAS